MMILERRGSHELTPVMKLTEEINLWWPFEAETYITSVILISEYYNIFTNHDNC